jgi:hypothetical protein
MAFERQIAGRQDARATDRPMRWDALPDIARNPYLWLSASLFAIMAIEAAEGGWVGDFWLHIAVVNELARSPLHPANPLVLGSYPDFYESPYLLLVALVVHATGLSSVAVLAVAGLANLVLLLVAFRLWIARLSPSSRVAAIGLVLVLLLWGTRTWQWSGFLNLAGLPLILPYPSTFATALMLLSWVLLMSTIRRPAAWRFAVLALTGAVMGLTNPYSLLNGMLGVGAILIAEHRSLSGRLVSGLVLAVVAGGLLALAWPYFSLLDALRSAPAADAIHRPLYQELLSRAALAGVGLPALWWRWRRRHADSLVWLFLFAALVLVLGGLTHHYALGRVWPVVVLPLQVAAAIEVAAPPAGRDRRLTIGITVLVIVAVIAGARGGAGGLARAIPASVMPHAIRQQLYIIEPPSFPVVARCVREGEVVATDNLAALRMIPAYGAKVIVPGYPDSYIPDEARRRADQDALFNAETSRPQVEAIVARYHVHWVLWDPAKPLAAADVYRIAARQSDGLILFAAPPRGVSPPAPGC